MSQVLIIFIGICSGLCFAKQNFDIILEHMEASEVNSEIVQVKDGIRKYNRTCKAYSSNFTLFKELDYGVKVEVQGFALFSNQYRLIPVLIIRSVCDAFKNEFLWVKNKMIKHSHFPTECPVRAGDYYVKDFVPNGADFPAAANFPWKSVMFRVRVFYKDAAFITIKVYVTLDHDAELKRLG